MIARRVSRRGCCGQEWKERMTNRYKFFESAIHVWYLCCGDGFIGHIEYVDMCHMSKLVRLYTLNTLNMCSLSCMNYASVKLFRTKWNTIVCRVIGVQMFYHFLSPFYTLNISILFYWQFTNLITVTDTSRCWLGNLIGLILTKYIIQKQWLSCWLWG